jgi:hypothetical protein
MEFAVPIWLHQALGIGKPGKVVTNDEQQD